MLPRSRGTTPRSPPTMLRVTELRLPIHHPDDALRPAVLSRLGIPDADLVRLEVYRRGVDARRKDRILLVYTVDCEVRHEAKVLNRHGSQLELAQTYQAPSTFGLPIKVVLAVEEQAPRWMRYRLLRGERILSLQGQWSLTRVRGGVLVDHQIALEPDLPGFLRPTYDELNESNLRQSMVVLRRLMLAR